MSEPSHEPTSPSPTPSGPPPDLYPKIALDALQRWDAGDTVFTIEMGGLGPGYEQCIQLLAFEIIRDHKDQPLPAPEDADHWGDDTVHRCNELVGGFSGAQVGAARALAYCSLRDGWAAMIKSAPQDRVIQVSRHWPQSPAL